MKDAASDIETTRRYHGTVIQKYSTRPQAQERVSERSSKRVSAAERASRASERVSPLLMSRFQRVVNHCGVTLRWRGKHSREMWPSHKFWRSSTSSHMVQQSQRSGYLWIYHKQVMTDVKKILHAYSTVNILERIVLIVVMVFVVVVVVLVLSGKTYWRGKRKTRPH